MDEETRLTKVKGLRRLPVSGIKEAYAFTGGDGRMGFFWPRNCQWTYNASGGSRSSAKEDERLDQEEHSGGPSQADKRQFRGSSRPKFAQRLTMTAVQHLKQIGKIKKLDKLFAA